MKQENCIVCIFKQILNSFKQLLLETFELKPILCNALIYFLWNSNSHIGLAGVWPSHYRIYSLSIFCSECIFLFYLRQKESYLLLNVIIYISAFFRVKTVFQDLKVTWALKVTG